MSFLPNKDHPLFKDGYDAGLADGLRLAKSDAASAEPPEKMHLAYNAIDRFLRNNLDDTDYATYSEHLEMLWPDPPAAPSPAEPDQPVAEVIIGGNGHIGILPLAELEHEQPLYARPRIKELMAQERQRKSAESPAAPVQQEPVAWNRAIQAAADLAQSMNDNSPAFIADAIRELVDTHPSADLRAELDRERQK